MDASERGRWLVDQLQKRGRVDVAAAAAEFGTAEMTIRRDLDALVQQGVARRVRGGAVSLLMRGEELPFAMREMSAAPAKQRIGTTAAELIADGEAVGLDGGTTVLEVARALRGRRLTVLPVSLHAAMAVAESSSVRLLMPGGEVRSGELSVVGSSTLAAIAALRLDTVILGCCGMSPDGQVTTHDLGDAAVKQALIGCARRTILVLDGSKFTHSAMAAVCDATSLDVVVTDDTAPAEAIASLEAAGTVVHRVSVVHRV